VSPEAQIWTAVAPIYAVLIGALVKWMIQRRNGDGVDKWNHQHVETLAQHETEIALLRQEQAAHGKRLEKLGDRTHALANDVQTALLKLRLMTEKE
jgi:hypothetical protein